MFHNHKLHTILLTTLIGLTSPLFADFKDDIDFPKLKATYGSSLPNGNNVLLAQIEYVRDGNWMPSSSGELAGKSFTFGNPVFGGTSQHANEVAAFLGGSSTSITPGVPAWVCFEATSYYQRRSLKGGYTLEPLPVTWDIENHSWGGSHPTAFLNALRKLDYRIERDGVTVVAAVDNGPNLSLMWSNAYNMISVGTSTGDHPTSGTTCEVAGRRKPDLVGTRVWTSYAAPIVSSCATLLIGKIKTDSALAEAKNPMVVKALLMAGATKSEFSNWKNSPTQPLDITFGAGEVNIFNSYETLVAGRKLPGASFNNFNGWDSNYTTGGTTYYRITVPAGKIADLSSVLTWHRKFLTDATWFTMPPTLQNLDLFLYNADSNFNRTSELSSSVSTIDNVEHIYAKNLPAGNYLLAVNTPASSERYGIAWHSELQDDPNPNNRPSPQAPAPLPPAPPPAAPVITSFTTSSDNLVAGDSLTLNWSTSNTSSLSLSPNIGDVSGLSSITLSPAATTDYVLTVNGPGGYTSSTLRINVSTPSPQPPPPPAAPVINSFTTSSANLISGDSTTLNWSTSNTSSLSLSPNIGDVSGLTSFTLSPTSTTDYVLTVNGPGGYTSSTLRINVTTPPPPPPPPTAAPAINSFNASSANLMAGNSTTLTWSTSHATSLSLSPNVGDVSGLSSVSFSPTTTTDYVLTATGPGGYTSSTLRINVSTPPPPPPPAPPAQVPPAPAPSAQVFGQDQSAADIGYISSPGSTSYDASADTLTLSVAGNDIAGYGDGFHFASLPVAGDAEITTTITGFPSSDKTSKAGLMFRVSDRPNSAHASILVTAQNYLMFVYRPTNGTYTTTRVALALQLPVTLKLRRQANAISAFYSYNGQTWSSLGTAEIVFGENALVGAVLTSSGTTTPSSAQYKNTRLALNLTPATYEGLSLYNIGATTEAASLTAASSVTLRANGAAGSSRDSQAFLAKTHSGDGAIATQVAAYDTSAPVFRAGLSFRETLYDSSARVFFGYNQNAQLVLETRGTSSSSNGAQTFSHTGRHLILDRRGNTYTALASHDGINWTVLGTTTLVARNDLWVGLVANSTQATTPIQITFNGFIETF